MNKNGPLSTPYENPGCATPGLGEATTAGTSGGWNLGGGPTETPNASGLPLLPTTVTVPDGPGPGTQISVDSAIAHPGMPLDGSV